MIRWVLIAVVAVLVPGTFPAFSWAQAAAEYGILAGSSATSTAKIGSTLNSKTNKLADRVQGRISKSLENVMEENKQKLEQKSREGGAALHIDSVPGRGTVSIDGAKVAHTPTELKVPEGKHVIEVTLPGYLPWRREVSLSRGENLSLKAELENMYKSVITLSIQK